MGMLLDDPDGVASVAPYEAWGIQLKNDRILLHAIDKAIAAFVASDGADGIQEYTMDTGQDRQTVKRADLGSLYAQREKLIAEIARIERMLYGGSNFHQVVPGF